MFLSNEDILTYINQKKIVIEPFNPSNLGPSSYDLTLSNEWWFFKKHISYVKELDWTKLMEKTQSDKIVLKPNEMCLGKTLEKIKLPDNIIGRLEGRSRYARIGLAVHITSALIQPGVFNHQILEIKNNSPYTIELKKGMKISQVLFAELKSNTSKPYRLFGHIAKHQ